MTYDGEVFPVISRTKHPGVPWPCLAAFLPRIWENHRMSTVALAARGVSPSEAVAILEDRAWKGIQDEKVALALLDQLIATWNAGRCRQKWGRYHGKFTKDDFGPIGGGASRPPDRARPTRRNAGKRDRPKPTGW